MVATTIKTADCSNEHSGTATYCRKTFDENAKRRRLLDAILDGPNRVPARIKVDWKEERTSSAQGMNFRITMLPRPLYEQSLRYDSTAQTKDIC